MEKNYDEYTDEEIIEKIRGGDLDAMDYLIVKFKNLVRLKAKTYFIVGADRDDIIQEGMIGLYKAIRDYKTESGVIFYAFADLCIARQIITAVKTATRQKHFPLNSSVSLNTKTDEPGLISNKQNPEELVIDREDKTYIESCMEKVLSAMEYKVISLYLKGESYTEIARLIDRDEKSVDNTLQRVKKKLERVLY